MCYQTENVLSKEHRLIDKFKKEKKVYLLDFFSSV